MRIAILHYHLKPGGVTRVIENAVAALSRRGHEVLVISGEPYAGSALPDTAVVEGLGYRDTMDPGDGERLAESIQTTARSHFGGDPDLWHIHNHSLGKNLCFPEAVRALLKADGRVLLQIHDFAEDGRPDQYERQKQALAESGAAVDRLLYPAGPQVHYAALNGRDLAFLRESGVGDDQLHSLPNPISIPADVAAAPPSGLFPQAKRFYLYPTRAIRRKNLGELLALSLVAPAQTVFATTLSPQNPQWRRIYEGWMGFAKRHRLAIRFGVGDDPDLASVSFSSWIARSDGLVTTSVAEGFGLAFLEPWLFGKPLHGRDLPAITGDFRAQGIRLDGLYDRLSIPLDWVSEGALRDRLAHALERSYAAYGRAVPADACERALASMVRDGGVDFGRLDEMLQERALEHWISRPNAAPYDAIALPWDEDPGMCAAIDSNRERIATVYSLERYGDTLERIYTALAKCEPSELEALDADRLLDGFLRPETFNLLRA